MPFPNPPKKISDEGLKMYLNRTATDHNGKNYDDFIRKLEDDVNRTKIAEKFGVARDTIYRWIAIYEEEKKS